MVTNLQCNIPLPVPVPGIGLLVHRAIHIPLVTIPCYFTESCTIPSYTTDVLQQ